MNKDEGKIDRPDGTIWLVKIGESYPWLPVWIDDGLVYFAGLLGPHKLDRFDMKFPSAKWSPRLVPTPDEMEEQDEAIDDLISDFDLCLREGRELSRTDIRAMRDVIATAFVTPAAPKTEKQK